MAIEFPPRDTTPEAARVYYDVLRRMGPEGRARLTAGLAQRQRDFLTAGVRRRHPYYTEEQVRLAVIHLSVGAKLFRQAFPGVEIEP